MMIEVLDENALISVTVLLCREIGEIIYSNIR